MEKYYVLKERAVPEVLLKVVEAQRLLEAGKAASVLEASEMVGISRSSYYKYKDDISLYHRTESGRRVVLVIQLDDAPGEFLSVLNAFAEFKVNIRNVHQASSVNGVANLMLVLETPEDADFLPEIVERIGNRDGVHYVKILAKE
ncbi:chorismate mutase [Lachnospiraceae bacterium XBB1006]|nr:chorismate mutase [Lachnospiraceae bacterium XBB1006]